MFVCLYFGKQEQLSSEWWNITARGFYSAKDAERHGKYMMPTAGVLGFAVIKENEDSWELIERESMLPSNYSLSCDNHAFSLQPAESVTVV
jgi:hypothetical protein